MSKEKIRLLWVFPSFRIGPAQERFATLAARLGGGYDHSVCALDGDYGAEAIVGPSAQWRRVEAPKRKTGIFAIGGLWSLRKFLHAERPDVLITSSWGGVEWLMVNRGPGAVPHIHFEEELAPNERPDALDQKRAWARRRAFSGRDRAFVASSRVIERLFSGSWGAPDNAVHYIPNGVDVSRFAASPRNASGRLIRLAFIGDLIQAHRCDRLIRLIATLRGRGRNVGLVLLGDGPEQTALEGLAAELDVAPNVDFVGAKHDLAPYLAQFDVFSFAPDAAASTTPLIQAMASGLPVLGTDVGDLKDMVAPENQLFTQSPDDESALAAAAELLVVDGKLRDRLGAANSKRAARMFSVETMVKRYDALFRDMSRKGAQLMLPAPTVSAQSA